jgi:5-methylcytosine-specific restriction endonuclease McrA
VQLDLGLNDPRAPEIREARLAAQRAEYAADEHSQDLRRKRHARAAERHAANHRAWYVANREERIEANRRWRDENPEKAYELGRVAGLRRHYGLTDEAIEYADVLRFDPCSYCGAAVEHIDHIEPVSKGGCNDWENLTGACQSCNTSKGDRPLLRFLLRRALLPAM